MVYNISGAALGQLSVEEGKLHFPRVVDDDDDGGGGGDDDAHDEGDDDDDEDDDNDADYDKDL